MSKRAFVLMLTLALIFCCIVPVRVDGAIVYSDAPEDIVSIIFDFQQQDVQNNIATDTYLLDSAQGTEYDLQYLFSSGWSSSSELTSSSKYFDLGSSGTYYGVTVDYYPSHYCLFSLDGLPALDWSTFALIYEYCYYISKSSNSPATPEITIEYRMTCYDSDRSEITDYSLDIVYSAVAGNSGLVTTTPIAFSPPDGTMYILPYIRFIVPYTLSLNTFTLYATSSYTLQQTYSLDGPGDSGGGGDGDGDTGDSGSTPTVDPEQEENDLLSDISGGIDSVVDGITGLPGKILDGITGLFVPSAEDMAGIKDKWDALLQKRFGAVYESIAIIDQWAQAFQDQGIQDTIHFPEVSIPLAGTDFVFGGWDIDVVPDGFGFLIEALKKFIDVACTLLFVNGMKNRYDKILEGRG